MSIPSHKIASGGKYWSSEIYSFLFNVNNPRDLLQGTTKGAANIVMGALLGAAMILSTPVFFAELGYHKDGPLGALKGLGIGLTAGVLGGTMLALSGTYTGVMQIGKGIVNTPAAFVGCYKGKFWNSNKSIWEEYNLKYFAETYLHMTDDEYLNLLHQRNKKWPSMGDSAPSPLGSYQPVNVVKDTVLYDILNTDSTASMEDIKRAYYLQAKKYHPDKNRNDPKAQSRFQSISTAYQVLSDTQKRAAYDVSGQSVTDGAQMSMEPLALFIHIFGSEKFEIYVGELKFITQINLGIDRPAVLEFRQNKREIQCAMHIAEKLDTYIKLNENDLTQTVQQEIIELTKTTCGKCLVQLVSSVYIEEAKAQQNLYNKFLLKTQRMTYSILYSTSVISAVIGVFGAMRAVMHVKDKLTKKFSDIRQEHLEALQRSRSSGSSSTGSSSNIPPSSSQQTYGTISPQRQTQTSHIPWSSKVPEVLTEDMLREWTIAERKELDETLFTCMHKAMIFVWRITSEDIRRTIRKSCQIVLEDTSINENTRAIRANTLLQLGERLQHAVNDVRIERGQEELLETLMINKEGLADRTGMSKETSPENPFS